MKSLTLALVTVFALICLAPIVTFAQDLASPPQASQSAVSGEATPAPIANARPTLAEPQPRKYGMWAGDPGKFFEGAFAAFFGHESGHLIANYSLGTDPYLRGVHYGPIPFFTIEPGRLLNPHEHYITASAGFNAQNIIDEWLLTSHPKLSSENQPFLKGLASFNFWLFVGYAASAFTETGPNQRDTKGMADALGWNERWVGAMILVPAALDTYRYKHPDSKWAVWASRASKLAMISLAADAQ